MKVIDQDTGKELFLDATPELTADLEPLNTPCSHSQKELRQKRNKGGALQYIDQCLRCGRSVGQFRKHSQVVDAPLWDYTLEDKYSDSYKRERAAIIQKHVRIQRNRTVGFWKQYDEYLKSPDWIARREKVFERAKGLCEGCRAKKATQVHHLTYLHVYNEFLFELVAVCDECHERLHANDARKKSEVESDEHPCCACRHQADFEDQFWCTIFNVSTDEALADSGECGPRKLGFEPLR